MVLAVWYLDPQASKLTNLQTSGEHFFWNGGGRRPPFFKGLYRSSRLKQFDLACADLCARSGSGIFHEIPQHFDFF